MKCKDSKVPEPFPGPVDIRCGPNGAECFDKDLIRKVIHMNAAAYRFCYESRLNSHPSLAGKVSVRFGINPSGQVPMASIAQSTVGDTELDTCVLGRTKLLQFPSRKTDGLVMVTYPFVFRSGAGSN
jgi:TonB family protein